MAIIKTSLEAAVHSICAEIVHQEVNAFENKSLASCVTVPTFAITARVIAAASQALWLVHETVNFLPRLLRISYGLAESNHTPLSPQFFHKAGQVYGLYLKTVGAQFFTGTLAIISPEIAYHTLELQKPLFSLQLDAFIKTLPELPHVQKHVRTNFPTVELLVELYAKLEFTNVHWKKALHRTIKKISDLDPIQGSQFLSTKSKLFQEAYFQALASLVCERFNQYQREGRFTRACIDGVHPALWPTIQGFMRDETKEQLITMLKESLPDAENNNYYIYLYKQVVSEYRTPDALLACQILFQKMKETKDVLLAKKVFSKDDIEAMYGDSYDAIIMLGLVRFLDSTPTDTPLTFIAPDGKRCSFSRDLQFFGEKKQLSAAKRSLTALSHQERTSLEQFFCGKGGQLTPNMQSCFNLLQGIKTRTIDKKIASETSIAWADIFSG